jgi:hypothetical protein
MSKTRRLGIPRPVMNRTGVFPRLITLKMLTRAVLSAMEDEVVLVEALLGVIDYDDTTGPAAISTS